MILYLSNLFIAISARPTQHGTLSVIGANAQKIPRSVPAVYI